MTFFEESLNKHQKLLNIMLEYEDENGICVVTQDLLSKRIDECSQSRVGQMINQINTEDMCIEKVKRGNYRVKYNDISQRGTYKKIKEIMNEAYNNPKIADEDEEKLALRFNAKIKTIQMFKSYYKTEKHQIVQNDENNGDQSEENTMQQR